MSLDRTLMSALMDKTVSDRDIILDLAHYYPEILLTILQKEYPTAVFCKDVQPREVKVYPEELPSRVPESKYDLPWWGQIVLVLYQNNLRLKAIKLVRTLTGCGLKEANDYCAQVYAKVHKLKDVQAVDIEDLPKPQQVRAVRRLAHRGKIPESWPRTQSRNFEGHHVGDIVSGVGSDSGKWAVVVDDRPCYIRLNYSEKICYTTNDAICECSTVKALINWEEISENSLSE